MTRVYILFILLCSQMFVLGQDRFVKKALESQQAGDYAESLDQINKYIEKEPLQPFGFLLKSKWLSDRLNVWADPDSAYNVLMLAENVFHLNYLKDSKESKKELFIQYVAFHDAEFLAYQDTLAKMVYERMLAINTIEKFDEYYAKYSRFGYATAAKNKAEHLRYMNVVKSDRLEDYQNFVRNYPDAADVPKANYRIHELVYDQAIANGSVEAFKIYISRFPNSHLLDNAWREVHRIEYDQVINSNDESKLESYLTSYPNSAYNKAVKNKLYEVAYQNVMLENTSQATSKYLQKFPESPYKENCLNLEMILKWQDLNKQDELSLQDLDQYLLDYPNTPFRDSVLSRQANLYFEKISNSEDPSDFIGFMNEFPNSDKFSLAKKTAISLLVNKATAFVNQEELEPAKEILDKILSLDINHAFSYYLYGHVLKEQGSLEEAISKISVAIQLDSKNAEYYAQRGLYYIDYNELGSANSDLNRAIGIDPYLPKANLGLGIIKDRRSEYAAAVSHYRRALSGGYEVSERIDYLESYIQQMRAERAERAERSARVETNNSKYNNKASAKKNLLLPKETIERLNKSKK